MALVFGRIQIRKPFDEWHKSFKAHSAAREALGIYDVMCAPVIGVQEVIYVVRTDHPRMVHDMSWVAEAKEFIEAAGHVLGTEIYTVCDEV